MANGSTKNLADSGRVEASLRHICPNTRLSMYLSPMSQSVLWPLPELTARTGLVPSQSLPFRGESCFPDRFMLVAAL